MMMMVMIMMIDLLYIIISHNNIIIQLNTLSYFNYHLQNRNFMVTTLVIKKKKKYWGGMKMCNFQKKTIGLDTNVDVDLHFVENYEITLLFDYYTSRVYIHI